MALTTFQQLRDLTARINRYRHEYHDLKAPSVTDAEYDRVLGDLTALEKTIGTRMADSPTWKIGYPSVKELKQVVHGVSALFPEEGVKFLTGEELAFGYRRSFLTDCPEAAVLYAVFRLSPGDPGAIRETMRDLMNRRRASQPLEQPSAGSTFKRPEGHFAGKLIMDAGLRGYRIGGAQVSEKHCGFVVNTGGATAADIRELIEEIRERVLDRFHVRLEPEVIFLGDF